VKPIGVCGETDVAKKTRHGICGETVKVDFEDDGFMRDTPLVYQGVRHERVAAS
jgi:hypothetical protein